MIDCSPGMKTVLLILANLLLPCTQQDTFEYVDMESTGANHHTDLKELWTCKEKLASDNNEMKADARDMNEDGSNMFKFAMIVVDILILLIHLIETYHLGVNSFVRNLLLYGSFISCCIGMVKIKKENSLIQRTAFIIETTNYYSILSINSLIYDIRTVFSAVSIIGSTMILFVILIHRYPIDIKSVVWFCLSIVWVGFSMKDWMQLDERTLAKLKSFDEKCFQQKCFLLMMSQ